MTRSPRDRPSAAEKKERQVRTGQVDRGMAVPATSADLVNLPQDFSLNSSWQRPARQCTNGFSDRRGKLHPERPASCRRSVVSGDRRLLLASLTGSERRGKLHPERPTSCRHSVVSGDRRLLLASLTWSERRGKLHPERPTLCRRSDPMMPILQPALGGEDSSIRLASSSTTHSRPSFMAGNAANAILGVSSSM